MYDIILVSIPFTLIELPPLGIAVLKGAVESEGFHAKTIDLNMMLYKHLNKDHDVFFQHQQYFTENQHAEELEGSVNDFFELWAKKLLAYNPRWIGLSVLSYYAHISAYILCSKLKKLNSDVKIVIGGNGVSKPLSNFAYNLTSATSLEKLLSYGEFLKKRKLVDEFIQGDGEQALIDLLRGKISTNEFHYEDYKNYSHPFANFDDYNLYDYRGQLNRNMPQIPIFSSKGCVRSCDFCDVESIQGRFRFRVGAKIAEEMIYLADKYKIRDFIFLDSLANGSLTHLKEWMTAIAEYNRVNPNKKITWSASGWICRPIGQMPEHLYRLMSESGCQSVSIGVESGSNRVLEFMQKKTNVEAVHYDAEQFKKYNVQFIVLLLIGHWSETWDDFFKTCLMIYKLSKYVRTGTCVAMSTGSTLILTPGTPAEVNAEKNNIIYDDYIRWWCSSNPSLTYKERIFRLLILDKLLYMLHVPVAMPAIGYTYSYISANLDIVNEFYNRVTTGSDLSGQQAEYYYNNFDKLLSELVYNNQELPKDVDISLDIEVSVTNEPLPRLEIFWNNKLILDQEFTEGKHTIALPTLVQDNNNSLVMRFSNKNINDTIVDENNNIVKDKFIRIKSFTINGIDILKDVDFFYDKLQYQINGVDSAMHEGFWFNGATMTLNFVYPFLYWYSTESCYNGYLDAHISGTRLAPRQIDARADHVKFNRKIAEIISKLDC